MARPNRDDDDEERPRRSRRDDDENRPRRERRDDEDDERPRRRPAAANVDDDEDEAPRRARRDDEDDERPRRRRPAADLHGEELRRKKKRKKKKSASFSLTEAIPLDLVIQVTIAWLLGFACFLGARFGNVDFLYLPGVLACAWSCAAYARNKGRSEIFALMGLFGPIGLAFTAVFAKPSD